MNAQDREREARIDRLRQQFASSSNLRAALKFAAAMAREIGQRSPAAVAELERQRGLA